MLLAAALIPSESLAAGAPSYRPEDPLNAAAFDHFYNLDYDRAVQEFEQILARHPNDPFAVNHLLTGVLFRELYRMGALNTGDYANDSFIHAPHLPPDPKVQQRIKDLVQRALELEEKRLNANPKDVDALYARGVTRAQFATYTGLVERAWFSALRNAVGARRDHERVLELDPNNEDARLIVGAHNYVLGSLPWSLKVAASMVGLAGSKEKGIQYLQQCATGNSNASIDAKILLVVFLRREGRNEEALTIARGLAASHPRDFLMVLEVGNLLRSLGRYPEAADVYRGVWQSGQAGRYGDLHYEIAALSLGDLLRSQKDFAGAATAYEMVEQMSRPDPEVLQKANLGAGEMYDLMQKRDQALAKYQAVIALNASTPPADAARRHVKDAYRE